MKLNLPRLADDKLLTAKKKENSEQSRGGSESKRETDQVEERAND